MNESERNVMLAVAIHDYCKDTIVCSNCLLGKMVGADDDSVCGRRDCGFYEAPRYMTPTEMEVETINMDRVDTIKAARRMAALEKECKENKKDCGKCPFHNGSGCAFDYVYPEPPCEWEDEV